MNPQKTNASGGRKIKAPKEASNSPSEQNNNVQAKKHPTSNINAKDSVNNNTIVDSQPKAEKEKSHSKVSKVKLAQIALICNFV